MTTRMPLRIAVMRNGWVFPIKDKSSKTIKALFKKWKKKVECQTGKKVKKMKLQ